MGAWLINNADYYYNMSDAEFSQIDFQNNKKGAFEVALRYSFMDANTFKDGEDIATKIQNLSNDFKEDYGSDFDLVVGVGAFRAIFPSKMVETLLRDNCVLIADCGPMNNEPGFPETTHDTIIVNRWYDIYQEYVKLIEDGVITKN